MRVLVWTALALSLIASVATKHNIQKRQYRRIPNWQRIGNRRTVSDPTPAGKRIVCYYTNWAVYRGGIAKFLPENVNPYLCTHLIYAFAGFTDDYQITAFDPYQDIDNKGYAKFNSLKHHNKNLRTLIAIGGTLEGSSRFSKMVSSKMSREVFINSAIRHIRRYGFDGLDLDWQYPGSTPGSQPEDKQNYASFVHELRQAFDSESSKSNTGQLLLTMAVPGEQNIIDEGHDIPSLNRDVDFFNILNYDYHTAANYAVVNNHANLLPLPVVSVNEDMHKLNINWTIEYYKSLGADQKKLVVGIPTYGRSFQLAHADYFEYGSDAIGAGTAGNYTKQDGFLAFYEICELMSVNGWQAKKPFPRSSGPFAYKGNQWVGYDDEGTATHKGQYVRESGLGGIMYWSLDTDDFRGICNGQSYPLIEAGKAALLGITKDKKNPGASAVSPITPAPPTTPAPSGHQCKRVGLFPNPTNCHQYFWCLKDSGEVQVQTCRGGDVFSSGVGGPCKAPSANSCKENRNDEGAATETKKGIEFTTPFPKFDYDYYYHNDDADYEDAGNIDAPAVDEPEIRNHSINNKLDNKKKTTDSSADPVEVSTQQTPLKETEVSVTTRQSTPKIDLNTTRQRTPKIDLITARQTATENEHPRLQILEYKTDNNCIVICPLVK